MAGIEGDMARLYDVFVDWPGRLGREIPGLAQTLRRAVARKVLDAGCGTGRHVAALLEAGFDAHGADASEDMLRQADGAEKDRFHLWRMGDVPPDELLAKAPFDALTCLGNTWPQLTEDDEVRATLAAFRRLLRPGGLVLLGLKAVAIRRGAQDPYLPLLRREHEGEPLYFVRFVDFDGDDPRLCTFHMVVVRGDAGSGRTEALLHEARRIRVWDPPGLVAVFHHAGFREVRVSARLDDPAVRPRTEDVFLHARAP